MKLVWTKQAIADLNHAHDYVSERNPDLAGEIIERIEKSLQALSSFPEIGRQGRVKETRELVVAKTPFILAYRVRQNRIEILGVIHGNRRWPESFQ